MEGVAVTSPAVSRISQTLDQTDHDQEYIRERLSPRPGDLCYLLHSDLRLMIKKIETDENLLILDYGADLSPYRPLFPNSDYRCADIAEKGALHYTIRADGTVPERSGLFDMILSTQVAEHVHTPDVYFRECLRLLKPGGNLFLSTHGSFEDHAFPNDFQRWTAEGLRRDLRRVGFVDITINKLTVGPRAGLFQLERFFETTYMSRKTLPGLLHMMLRVSTRWFRPWIHRIADNWYADYRIVRDDMPYQNTYVLLTANARRPEEAGETGGQSELD
jgi:SAM-dependent methyltransferase